MSEHRVPKWVNTMMKWMLQSPFHGNVSKSIMLISFTGRKTGKRYTTPIRYMRTEQNVIAFTQEKWWKNLQDGKPVELRLQGRTVRGIPAPVREPANVIQNRLQEFLSQYPSDAKYYNVAVGADGQPNRADVERAAEHTILLEFQLQTT